MHSARAEQKKSSPRPCSTRLLPGRIMSCKRCTISSRVESSRDENRSYGLELRYYNEGLSRCTRIMRCKSAGTKCSEVYARTTRRRSRIFTTDRCCTQHAWQARAGSRKILRLPDCTCTRARALLAFCTFLAFSCFFFPSLLRVHKHLLIL